MQNLTSLAALTALCLTLPLTAKAQSACGDHETMSGRLAAQYGEDRRAMGLGSNNTMLEIYASDESGSWTILITKPGGLTCLVAAGEHFQVTTELAAIDDEGA